MKKLISIGLLSLLMVSGVALANQSGGEEKDPSSMPSHMDEMMKGDKGMEGMGGMMRMMKMMNQCASMMDSTCRVPRDSEHWISERASKNKPDLAGPLLLRLSFRTNVRNLSGESEERFLALLEMTDGCRNDRWGVECRNDASQNREHGTGAAKVRSQGDKDYPARVPPSSS